MTTTTARLDRLEKNLLINGAFDFWQRGTTVSISNAAVGRLADRWSFRPGSANGTGTMLRSTNVPTQAQSGFQSTYSLQITAPASGGASSANTSVGLAYYMEGLDYTAIHSKACRYQFWVRSSVTGTYYAIFMNSDTSRYYLAAYTVSVANTWEKKTIDLTMDTAGTWLFDNSAGLIVMHILQVGSSRQAGTVGSWQTKTADGSPIATASQVDFWATPSATFQLAQAALYEGSFSNTVDINFHRAGSTIQQELAMCQRYYEKSYNIAVIPGTAGAGGEWTGASISDASGSSLFPIRYVVVKRTTPTFTAYSDAGTINKFDRAVNGAASVEQTALTSRAGEAGLGVYAGGTTGGDRNQIQCHFTADAEF